MTEPDNLKVYFVVGEESGDILGSKLIRSFREKAVHLEPVGLAGSRMQAEGMTSLFDISDISVMGISGVLAQLPKLLRRIKVTADDVIARNPDVLLLIDSPEFSYRVAQKVRKKAPWIKIVKYVAPSVWAWRPGRAKKMAPYVDHIMAILPFEPELMESLGGPKTTYVGHPLASEMPDVEPSVRQKIGSPPKLLLLPGSRKSEVKRLLPFIKETVAVLERRGNTFQYTLPAVEKLREEIEAEVSLWPQSIQVICGKNDSDQAFREADLALAASGTVTLELALYRVPMISIYKLDGIAMRVRHLLTGWTASLPNLIADYPVVPERFNEYAHPEYVARMVERLAQNSEERRIQLEGFELIRNKMAQETPGHDISVTKILELTKQAKA